MTYNSATQGHCDHQPHPAATPTEPEQPRGAWTLDHHHRSPLQTPHPSGEMGLPQVCWNKTFIIKPAAEELSELLMPGSASCETVIHPKKSPKQAHWMFSPCTHRAKHCTVLPACGTAQGNKTTHTGYSGLELGEATVWGAGGNGSVGQGVIVTGYSAQHRMRRFWGCAMAAECFGAKSLLLPGGKDEWKIKTL